MYSSDIFQLNIFLYSVGFGFLSALVYDVFKAVQTCFFYSYKGLFIKDIFYSLTFSYLCFVFMLSVNNGKVRIYLVLGVILGFFCWFVSLSVLFLKYFECLIKWLKSIIFLISRTITFPIRLFFSIVTEKILKKSLNYKDFCKKAKNKLKIHLKKR